VYIGDDTKAAACQSPNCIKKTKKIWRKTIFNYGRWNSYTLQCGRWLWDDMSLNSPKRQPWFRFRPYHRSRHVILHQSAKFLSKSDHPRQTKMRLCRFSRWRISAILDFRAPVMGSLKSPCTTSYRSSVETMAVNKLMMKFHGSGVKCSHVC